MYIILFFKKIYICLKKEMEPKYKLALRGGVILSLVFILKNISELIFSIENYVNISLIFKILILIFGMGLNYYIIKEYKKNNNDFIDFKNAFSIVFLTWITAVLISTIFDFIFYNYLSPELSLQIKEYSISSIRNLQDSMPSLSEENLEDQIYILENTDLFSLKNISTGFLYNIPLVAILSGVISLILKSKN